MLGLLLWAVLGGTGCEQEPSASDVPLDKPEPDKPIDESKPLPTGAVIPLTDGDPKAPPRADADEPPQAVSDVILAGMHAQARRFAGGMVVATPMFRGSLVNGATQDFQAILQPAHCFKIVGVGGPTVKDLDLLLFDPNGVQVQQDTATDSYPVLGLHQPICPTSPGAYRVQVRMYKGAGDFGVQVFHSR